LKNSEVGNTAKRRRRGKRGKRRIEEEEGNK
jgi:hypothetical protein